LTAEPHSALPRFDYLTTEGNFSWFVRETSRYSGAVIMYLVAKKLQKKYNIGDPREDLYGAVTLAYESEYTRLR